MSTSSRGNALVLGVGAILGLGAMFWYYRKQPDEEEFLDGDTLSLPVVDLSKFFKKEEQAGAYLDECKKVAYAFHNYGLCIVRDPRVNEKDNNTFIDMMERYFEGSDGVRDARPEVGFQVGVTQNLQKSPLIIASVLEHMAQMTCR